MAASDGVRFEEKRLTAALLTRAADRIEEVSRG
jgi:hypothetical protein